MTTCLYMIRHALSPFSLSKERERGLSDQGQADAEKVAMLLMNEGIDVVVSSPFRRAAETVRGLADRLNLPIIEFEDLRERLIARADIQIDEDELLRAIEWSFVDMDYCLTGGETTADARRRAIPVIRQLLTEYAGKKIAVGTHGNIMTIILNAFNPDYGYNFWKQTTKPDIYKLEFEDMHLVNVQRMWRKT